VLVVYFIIDQGWGGSIDLQTLAPDGVYPSLEGDDGIRWNYKVTTPASTIENLQWNVKVLVNSTGGQEEWHGLVPNFLADDSGEWQEAKLNFSGLAIPNWLPTFDGVFYKDSIAGVVLQMVTNQIGLQTAGEVCLDNLTSFQEGTTFYEGYYLNDCESPETTINSNQNSNAGSYVLSASDDAYAGDSSVCVSYGIVGDQGWGGSVDMNITPTNGAEVFQDFSDHLGISFWYKVNMPVDVPANASFVVKIFDGVAGEQFHRSVGGMLNDASGEWTQVRMNFDDFATPNWLPSVNGVIDRDSITEVQFQILVLEGTTINGGICFDDVRSFDDEEVTDLIDPPLSVIPIANTEMKIFPNPAVGQLFIDGVDKVDRVEVYSLNGELVKMVSNGYNKSIDVNNLTHGLYFLKIYSERDVYSAKFMKQ